MPAQASKPLGTQPKLSLVALALGAACSLAPALAFGQRFETKGVNLQKASNAVLSMMGLMLTPDVTTGSLSFSNDATGNPDFSMTSLGGGFTISKGFPLYLEGTAGYSRYDPTFIASNGAEERTIPVKWNVATVTAGVGWDFPVAKNLVLRPMLNFSYGRLESDTQLAARFVESKTDATLQFLDGGKLEAYGLGGSLMLDYEDYQPEREIDVELRYTNIHLKSFGATSTVVQGAADAQTINLWTRWRAPTGVVIFERPLRYVLEYVHTRFLGDLDGVLGFNHLNSVGAGLELDVSKYDTFVSRLRLVGRYKFGDNVTGWSVGFAVSF
jgi:hypothetical protein